MATLIFSRTVTFGCKQKRENGVLLRNNLLKMEVARTTDLFSLFNNKVMGPVPQEAIKELEKWGLIPREGNYKCPNGHLLKLKPISDGDGWEWRCPEKIVGVAKRKVKWCSHKVSLRKGTFFEKSKLSVFQILEFVLLWTKNVPLSVITEESSISPSTGVDWNNFCREVVVYSSFQSTISIGGPGVIVEIDESKIGKRKYHRGHYVEGQWIFGGVERESGRCFMVPVEDRTRETLTGIIKQNIRPGSVIVSDGWKAYDRLSEEGYTHFSVNHSVNFKDPVTLQHTNTIEGLWRHLKASLPTYNRRKIFFNGYIQKFIFLRWYKANNKNKFIEFCRYAGSLYDPMQVPDVERQRYEEEAINLYFTEEEDDVGVFVDDGDPLG